MATCSSGGIFNPIRYTGLYIRRYDLDVLVVVHFTCIGIRIPSVPG